MIWWRFKTFIISLNLNLYLQSDNRGNIALWGSSLKEIVWHFSYRNVCKLKRYPVTWHAWGRAGVGQELFWVTRFPLVPHTCRHAVCVPGTAVGIGARGRLILTQWLALIYNANEPCVFRCFKTVQFEKRALVFYFWHLSCICSEGPYAPVIVLCQGALCCQVLGRAGVQAGPLLKAVPPGGMSYGSSLVVFNLDVQCLILTFCFLNSGLHWSETF